MKIVYDEAALQEYFSRPDIATKEKPVLIDRFLEEATEVDVDALSDGKRTVVCGVMEHIEEAGIHSGDSACSLPPYSLSAAVIDDIKRQARALAKELKVVGLMNVQFAVKDGTVYVLEVNPRASRTIPFVSKATGIPIAKLAAKVMVGKTLDELEFVDDPWPKHVAVKESTFPFNKFAGVDPTLGPEMRSTGEVMGIARTFAEAFAKAQIAAGTHLPVQGKVFVSLADRDKPALARIGRTLVDLGFELIATSGTARLLRAEGIAVTQIEKVNAGRPNIIDCIKNDEVALIINTPSGSEARADEGLIRMEAITAGVPCITTLSAANAALQAIVFLKSQPLDVAPLQDWHAS